MVTATIRTAGRVASRELVTGLPQSKMLRHLSLLIDVPSLIRSSVSDARPAGSDAIVNAKD